MRDVPSARKASLSVVQSLGIPVELQAPQLFNNLDNTSDIASIKSGLSDIKLSRESDKKNAAYERIMEAMEDPEKGVPVKDRSYVLKSHPSTVTGSDVVNWLLAKLRFNSRDEALLFANKMFLAGYLLPLEYQLISDAPHFYLRLQTPFFWPSTPRSGTDSEHANYLYRLVLRKVAMKDYEAGAFLRLQQALGRRWDFITAQANEQLKLQKTHSSDYRIIYDHQEKGYWWYHRPPPDREKLAMQVQALQEQLARPETHKALLWAASLTALMECEEGSRLYGEFLSSEYSRENLDFWKACEDLRVSRAEGRELKQAIRAIYVAYLHPTAPHEINIPADVRNSICRQILDQQLHPNIFDPAQAAIFELMNKDSYPRFIKSDIFQALLKAAQASSWLSL
eukprot:comp18214_c0_seq1/m.19128 comp18214_c0_seq1/g.19128  ORF comp18214_c0_seq1/g.19128 comp18214_c0_seq1/m.19128 type:complete len:396 (-) comp18214_c0_seq1:451-1638(-)